MLYVNDDYLSYHYIVSYSDNYVVLSNSRRVYGSYDNPEEINVLVQYFSPSDLYFTTTQTFYNDRTFNNIDVTSSDWQRNDLMNVFVIATFMVLLTLFVYNILSKIFVRGGFLR